MDSTLVAMEAQELVKLHKLKEEGGQVQATTAYLQELDEKLQALGYDSTPTIAAHAWAKSSEYFAQVQKKTSV